MLIDEECLSYLRVWVKGKKLMIQYHNKNGWNLVTVNPKNLSY